MKTFVAGVVLITSAVASAAPASAQTDVERSRQVEADTRFNAALKLHAAGRDAEARTQLEQAYAMSPDIKTLFNLARMEQLTGDPVLALHHFRTCLASKRLPPDATEMAKQRIAELSAQLGRVVIDTPPDATEITVDADPAKPGEVVDVTPGRHVVQAKLDGRTQAIEVTSTAGASVTAHLAHAVIEAPVPAATTRVPPTETPTTTPPASTFNATKWITVGAAGVAGITLIVVGIGYGAAASSAGDDVARLHESATPSCQGVNSSACSDLLEATQRQARNENLRTGFLVSGGVLVAGAATAAFIWPDHPEERRTGVWRVRPEASLQSLGATMRVTFE